jgi:hypothetical protein
MDRRELEELLAELYIKSRNVGNTPLIDQRVNQLVDEMVPSNYRAQKQEFQTAIKPLTADDLDEIIRHELPPMPEGARPLRTK